MPIRKTGRIKMARTNGNKVMAKTTVEGVNVPGSARITATIETWKQ
jgi:hypothetical protein